MLFKSQQTKCRSLTYDRKNALAREHISYLCKKSSKKMEKLEMLFMYHSRSRIRVEQVIGCFLDIKSKQRISRTQGTYLQ